MNSEEKARAFEGIVKVLDLLVPAPEDWVDLAKVGAALTAVGVDYKSLGFLKLRQFLNEFDDRLEFREDVVEGKTPVMYLRRRGMVNSAEGAPDAQALTSASDTTEVPENVVKETKEVAAVPGGHSAPLNAAVPDLSETDKAAALRALRKALGATRSDAEGWVDLAQVGGALTLTGFDYKAMGFMKLRLFLNALSDSLDFKEENPGMGKSPVVYLRFKGNMPVAHLSQGTSAAAPFNNALKGIREPSPEVKLFKWALILPMRYRELAALALPEKWYYGDQPPKGPDDLPILRSYLLYTFKRLCHEKKVLLSTDQKGGEYAAFNTGLVDTKYEYIYAFFTKNTQSGGPYCLNFG